MKLLAVDPATTSGWATADAYGVWKLTKRANESDGIKWLRFRAELREIIALEGITVIAYERPGGHHVGAVIHHAKLVAVIEELCADLNIEYKGYSSAEIKKHATGKGNCNKQAMIDAAVAKLDYQGSDDNEADALWLYELAAQDLGI